MANKPVLAIVTQAIRRDIHSPLQYFKHFQVIHFYHEAPYGDMTQADFRLEGVEAIKFSNTRDLYKKVKSVHPAVVQGAEPYASRKALRFSFAALRAAKHCGAKFIFPMLENRPAESRFGVLAPLVKSLLRRYSRQADLIFTLNSGAQRNLLAVGTKKEKIMPFLWGVWGVDTKLFSPTKNGMEPKWSLPTIIYIGRLVEEKGIEDIVEAFKKLTSVVSAQLVFVGSGPMESYVKKYNQSGDSRSKIVYLGAKAQKDLPPLLRASVISIYPSRTMPKWEEQVGTVNMQAMSCSVPVVSTMSGAIPEYVPDGKAGLLVPENNPDELAKALLAIINNKQLAQKFGKYGRGYALDHFDTKKNVEKGEQWLLKIIK